MKAFARRLRTMGAATLVWAAAAEQAVRFDIDPTRLSLFDTAEGHRL